MIVKGSALKNPPKALPLESGSFFKKKLRKKLDSGLHKPIARECSYCLQ